MKTTNNTVRSRNWAFTINNYTDDDTKTCDEWYPSKAKYVLYGKEVGEEGTHHLQGFVMLKADSRLTLMKTLHGTAHWEACKGTATQNIDYCTKEGNYIEHGDRPKTKAEIGQAEKDRWEEAKELAAKGLIDEVPADIYIRFYRTLKEIRKDNMVMPDDADDVTGVWIYGPPGCGKSKRAREDYPNAYMKMQNKWWDGYQEQEFVILDDFDSPVHGHNLKIWCDRYAFTAETKGGAISIRPKKIIITSNYAPEHFADVGVWGKEAWDQEMLKAIRRRMQVIQMPKMFYPEKKE